MDDVVQGVFRVLGDANALPDSTECYEAWVLRRNGSASLIDISMLAQEMTLPKLMGLDHQLVRQVPEELIAEWGLRHADRVHFDVISNQLRILRVWDTDDPQTSRSRPEYGQLVRGTIEYPSLEFPFSNRELWPARLVAPAGLGSQYFIAGPYGSGKTTTSQQMLGETLSFTRALKEGNFEGDPRWQQIANRIVFVIGQFAERNTDTTEMGKILGGYKDLPIYHFCPPHGNSKMHENRNTADFAIALVERLYELGYHVILVEDSLRGLALEAYSPHAPTNDRPTTGGISSFALEATKFFAAHAGSGQTSSVTGLFTALSGERTQGGQIFAEAGGPESTSALMHLSLDASVPRPWIDLFHPTGTRKVERMLAGKRLELHFLVQAEIARRKPRDSRQPPVDALRSLQDLVGSASGCATFEQASQLWLTKLSSTTHPMVGGKGSGVRIWQDFVNATFALQQAPENVRQAALKHLMDVLRVSANEPVQSPAQSPMAVPGKSLVAVTVPGSGSEPSQDKIQEHVPAETLADVDVAMISVQEMMNTWKTLRGNMPNLPPPSKVRCKKLLDQEGFVTLAEFESYIRAGKLR